MASLEKLSASLESKRKSLRKAILFLTLGWKDFEKHLDSTQQVFEEFMLEIETRENHLDLVGKSVTESNKELELLRIDIKERFEGLEVKEEEFKLFQEENIRDFKLKEEKLGSIRESIEERMKEVELREEKLSVQQKLVEGLFEKLELEHKKFEPIQRLMDERFKENNVKEMHFENRSKELNSIQNWLERRAKELDTKEEYLEERCKELDLKEKEFDSIQKLTEERCKELEVKEKQLDSAKNSNEEWSGKLDSREKQFNSVKNFVNQCFKDFRSKKKQLKSEENLLDERSKELELKEKQLENWSKELQLKEEKFANTVHSHEKIEQLENTQPDNGIDCSYADIRFCITMDGKSLQMYLNERSNQHDVMSDEICNALRLSLDPAKLVLDAMDGFYPPHLKKEDTEFEGNVVRRSCILLLEQLITISSRIQPHVKEEALKLAHEWKVKMGAAAKNSLEVLGFLQLLASYKLTSEFDADELWNLFEIVGEHKAAPKLCRVLGFADKIPDLIQNFIKKKQYLVALRYICAFEIVNKFPPVPLLREHLKYYREMAYKLHNVQNRAIEERVAAVGAVIRGIVGHELEIKYSTRNLEECIEQLIMLKDSNVCTVPASEKKLTLSITDPIPTKTLNNAPILPKIAATTMAFILAKLDGKRLQIFLNEHLEEHELLHNEVSTALQISVDSAKLVLDAMQGFYPPHLKKGNMDFEACICRRSCMLLLEQLMRLSPQITPEVKEEAKKLAVDWKKKMRSEIEILGFFQIVGAYRMASAFDVDELSILFGTVVHLRHAPELCQVLGFSENIPVSDVLHSQEEVDQSSSENSLFSNKVASSSVRPQVEFKSLCTNMERKEEHHSTSSEVSSSIQLSLDPAKLVLDALQGCYYSNLKGNTNPRLCKVVLRSCVFLLEELMRVSPEIKPRVQEEAMYFAVDWKLEMVKSQKPLKVLIFLKFVAIYKLVSIFNADELLSFLGGVQWHERAIDLFRVLELADKIPDFIQKLIEREQRLVAIKYIYAYGLVDKFPPVPLLKGHLIYSKEIANKICKEGNNSLKAQDRATKQEVDALRAVIKCITDLGLESEFSPENLKIRIVQLEMKSADRRIVVPHPASEAQPQNQAGTKIISPTPARSSEVQPQKEAGIKCIGPTPAPASKDPPQKQTRRRVKTHIAPTPAPAPSSEAQPQKEAEIKCNATTPAPSSEAQLQKQDGKKCMASSPASKDPPKKRTRRRVKKCIAPTATPAPASAPSSEAQLQKEAGIKCNATAPAPAPAPSFEAQQQKQTGKKCIAPASEAQLQKQASKKRIAPTPVPASKAKPQHQCVEKRLRTAISEAAASKAPVGTACPVHSGQPPPQRPAYLFPEQGAPYLSQPAEYCSPRGFTPVTSHMSHLNWQYGSGAPANSAMTFGSAGYRFGSAANSYSPPFMAPGMPHLYHSWRYPQPL